MPTSSILPKPNSIPPALPPSVEQAYRQKCIDLKRRMNEVEETNDAYRIRKLRLNRGILKLRLERAFLLEQLADRTAERVDDSEGSPSPPPTPQDKPLRLKRGHRRSTNPVNGGGGGNSPSSVMGPETSLPPPPTTSTSKPTNNANNNNNDPPSPSAAGTPSSAPPPKPNNNNKSSSSKPSSKPNATTASSTNNENPTISTTNSGTRRPTNAYMLYCADKRPELEREHADDEDGYDVPKALARSWRDLGADGQKPWMEKYAEMKAGAAAGKEKEKKGAAEQQHGEEEERDEEKEKEKEKGEGRESRRRTTGGFTAVNR